MNDLKQFKEASETISSHRREVKTQMDSLTDNLYTSLHQLNFSLKLIVDADIFLTKYVSSGENLLDKLTAALTTAHTDTTIDLYDDIAFNSIFISGIIYFENFAKVLSESISHYLIVSGTVNTTMQHIHSVYSNKYNIKNEWNSFKNSFDAFSKTYKDIFAIVPLPEADLNDTQITLANQFIEYKSVFDSLSRIISETTTIIFSGQSETITTTIRALDLIINFKNKTLLYPEHVNRLSFILTDTSLFFRRISEYARKLIDHATQYNSSFKLDNQYLTIITNVCLIANDLIAALLLRYPNVDSCQGLITDTNFTRVLTIINNLYSKEITTSTKLIDQVSSDYKLIKSLETFITTDKAIDNSVIFKIMNDFDNEIKSNIEGFQISSSLKLYFDITNSASDIIGSDSYTHILTNLSIMTDPLYDLLNYYRLFLFPFTSDTSLIFDFLETLFIFNCPITNSTFNTAMSQLFEIKINNIDYKNINPSKINESITSRYESLNNLNYFNITPYIEAIRTMEPYIRAIATTDTTAITDIAQLFASLTETDSSTQIIPTYNLMLFTITENILYNNTDLTLIMRNLSIKSNIRTLFFKIIFTIAINQLITTIISHYGDGNSPDTLTIYPILRNNAYNDTHFKQDLLYLTTLLSVNEFYNGNSTTFNLSKITNFTSIDSNDYIWDTTKLPDIIQLLSLYKEV